MAGMPVRHMFIVDMLDIDSMKVLLYIVSGLCIIWLVFYARFYYMEKKMYRNSECKEYLIDKDKYVVIDKYVVCGLGLKDYGMLNLDEESMKKIIQEATFAPFTYPVKVIYNRQMNWIEVYSSLTFINEHGGGVDFFKFNESSGSWYKLGEVSAWGGKYANPDK